MNIDDNVDHTTSLVAGWLSRFLDVWMVGWMVGCWSAGSLLVRSNNTWTDDSAWGNGSNGWGDGGDGWGDGNTPWPNWDSKGWNKGVALGSSGYGSILTINKWG